MDAKKRREELLKLLRMDIKPMSATNIAEHFGVSRQIIVGDVALLRAAGHDIVATQSGYVLNKSAVLDEADTYIIACNHDKTALQNEIYTIVDFGGTMLDISIDHPIFGTVTQPLNIGNRFEADNFLKQVALTGSKLLSSLTDGAHLHTIRCQTPEAYRRILAQLRQQRILYMK